MGTKDFFVINDSDNCFLFHAPSLQIAKINSNLQISDDIVMYEKFQRLKKDNIITKYEKKKKNSLEVVFMAARTCNLCCGYCFAEGGDYGTPYQVNKKMEYRLYMDTIKYLTENKKERISKIGFFGGEPLLDFDEIFKFIPDIIEYFKNRKQSIPEFSISTNLLLLNKEIAELLKKYNIKIACSLDGPEEINDYGRKFKNSKNSVYMQTIKKIQLLENYNIEYHIQMVIHKKHMEIYEAGAAVKWIKNFEKFNCKSIVIAPVSTKDSQYEIKEDLYEKLDQFTREVTQYYLNKLKQNECDLRSTEMINPILHLIKKEFRAECSAGYNLFIDTDGTIYPCHMFCGYQEFALGNINKKILNEKKRKEIWEQDRITCETCNKCFARGICAVWCKGIHLSLNNSINKICETRCVFQKAIFEECIKMLGNLKKGTSEYLNFINNMKIIFGAKHYE